MTTTDRYYHMRSLGTGRLRPGAAGLALERALAGREISDGAERTVIQAMSDCHVRRMELVVNSSANVMFPIDAPDGPLTGLNEGYRHHIRSIIHATMQSNTAWELDRPAIDACAWYVNLTVRSDIADGRRRVAAITASHSDALQRALEGNGTYDAAGPDGRPMLFRHMMDAALAYTADFMDPMQIPADVLARAAAYAVRTELHAR